MTEHSPVISDEEMHKAIYGYPDVNPHYYIKDENRKVAQAQRDASDAYWKDRIEKLINLVEDYFVLDGYNESSHAFKAKWQALTKEEG